MVWRYQFLYFFILGRFYIRLSDNGFLEVFIVIYINYEMINNKISNHYDLFASQHTSYNIQKSKQISTALHLHVELKYNRNSTNRL